MADLFASARRSLRRSLHHISDLGKRLNAINDAKEYVTVVIEPDHDGIHQIHKARFNPLFRDEFPSIVFDAVSNCRACLDQMTYAISAPRGLDPSKYAPFPICKDIEFIDNQINGLKYLPAEIRMLFRSFNPYKGGNDTLWAQNESTAGKDRVCLRGFPSPPGQNHKRPASASAARSDSLDDPTHLRQH